MAYLDKEVQSWTDIQNVICGPSSNPGIIARDSNWTIVVLLPTTLTGGSSVDATRVQSPLGAQVGDLLQICFGSSTFSSGGAAVQVPAGELIYENGTASPSAMALPITLRRVSSYAWAYQL